MNVNTVLQKVDEYYSQNKGKAFTGSDEYKQK